MMQFFRYVMIGIVAVGIVMSCSSPSVIPGGVDMEPVEPAPVEEPDEPVVLHDIDLNHWKVTLPVGSPSEVEPPEILDYASIEALQPYMYDDQTDSSLVFYTAPGSTTANSKYSRTELREQMEPGSNKVNWTFAQGGRMKGTLRVSRVSGEEGKLDRIIVMQIHGRLTDAQRDLIGEDDNNAPPVLKIYWDDGKVDVRRKVLKDLDTDEVEELKTSAWKDEAHYFDQEVGFDRFTIEVIAAADHLTVKMGDEELRFDDEHVERWGVFENYFKAGNYLQSTDPDSYGEVKYYSLEVSH